MNHMKKSLTVLAASICLLFTGCSSENLNPKYQEQNGVIVNTESKSTVVILGSHACSMQASEDVFLQLEKDMDDNVYGGSIALIIADSTPTKIELEEQKFFAEDRKNADALDHEINRRKNLLINDLKEKAKIPPDSPETDLLQAIREAKSILSESTVAKKEIIIIDTGLSTAGDLNLCNIDFNEDPSERKSTQSIIDEHLTNFEGHNLLPDLSGIDVVFYGSHGNLVPAAPPQSDNMVTADEIYIKNLWQDIVTQCSAASVSFAEVPGFDTPILEGEEENGIKIPHVSTILFKRLIMPNPPGENETDGDPPSPPNIDLKIQNASIGFEGNTAKFTSLENFTTQYKEIPMEIQTYLSQYPEGKIYIAGAVATFGNDNGYALSLQRSEAIKKLFTDGAFKDNNGNNIIIPAEQIATIGLGDKFPEKTDEWATGTFDTVEAANNRKVFIFNENAEYYEKLKTALKNNELYPETQADIEKAFSNLN